MELRQLRYLVPVAEVGKLSCALRWIPGTAGAHCLESGRETNAAFAVHNRTLSEFRPAIRRLNRGADWLEIAVIAPSPGSPV